MGEIFIDIVTLPPIELRRELGEKVKAAGKDLPAIYLLDNDSFIPHQSLFHFRTSEEKLGEIFIRVEKVLTTFSPFEIRSRNFDYSDSVVILLSEPTELLKLHEEIVQRLYSLRTGEMPWNPLREPNELEKQYRDAYGTEHILKNFLPHITLAKFNNNVDAKKFVGELGRIEFNYTVDAVAITEVNELHQVTNIIKEFRLKKEKK